MGRRHFIKPYDILSNVDISSDQEGSWTDVSMVDALTYLVDWSGNADGEIQVEISNKEDKSNVHTLNFGSTIAIEDAADPKQHTIMVDVKGFKFIKIKYVSNSGSGNLTATLFATARGA